MLSASSASSKVAAFLEPGESSSAGCVPQSDGGLNRSIIAGDSVKNGVGVGLRERERERSRDKGGQGVSP